MNPTGMRTEWLRLDRSVATAIRPNADIGRSATLDRMTDADSGASRLVVYILAANLIALAAIAAAVWWFASAGDSGSQEHQVNPPINRSSRPLTAVPATAVGVIQD